MVNNEVSSVNAKESKTGYIKALEFAIDKAVERIESEFPESFATKMANGMLQRLNQQNHKQTVDSINNSIGVDVSQIIYSDKRIREELEVATIQNVNLIKSVKSGYLDDVRKSVVNAAVSGERHESIIKEIARVGRISEKRAKLIARDQTSKINSALTKARQEKLGVTEYIWSTSNDQRVRHDHAERDGKKFKWNEPPPDGHPGHAINCRCVAIPVIEFD